MTDPKVFPIQDYRPIPWGLIAPHEEQAAKNHGGQTLQRLAERGGLSPCEALCAIRGDGIGRLLREPHGLRRDKQTGETICRCTCAHELEDLAEKHRRERSAPSELERLREALRLSETTRNAAQDIATRETERRREVEERLAQIDAELDSLKNFYVHLASWLEARAEADAMRELAWRWCWVARDGWELSKVLAAGEGPIAVAPGPAFEKRTATGTLTVRAGDVLEGIEGRTTTRILVVYVSEETLLARQLWSRRDDGMAVGDPGRESTWTLGCRDWRKVEEGHDHG